jgi:sec-independent protein translocase protein TatC
MENEPKSEMTFLEHLEVLRWHLVRSAFAVLVFATLAFLFKDIVFDQILLAPKSPNFISNRLLCELGQKWNFSQLCINRTDYKIVNLEVTGQFNMHIMVSIIAGLIVAFPYIFWELWRFIAPALRENERKYARRSIFYISLLFLLGIGFGYFIIIPMTVDFFFTYQVSANIENLPNMSSYISTVAATTLGCGLVFEIPVIIFFLSKIGLMSSAFLKKVRKHALVVILIIAAIITPPDVVSQIIVTLPLVLLYELGIIIARRNERKREREVYGK